jgi:hypothetical protein
METPKTNANLEDWRTEITEPKDTLKVKDGDVVIGTFAGEGTKKQSEDYGTSIMFPIIVDGEKESKNFYVKTNNFDLLGQIKALGNLTGLKVRITRIGAKRSDTRYKIVKI